MRTPLVLLAVAPLLVPTFAPGAEGRETLQELLARLRRQSEVVLNALAEEVDALVAEIEAKAVARELAAMDAARAKLVRFGPVVAPLLVERIDPGTSPTDAQRLRGQYVALALRDLRAASATARLVELAQAASTEGRQNALVALAGAPDVERAAPVVVGVARGGPSELRPWAFQTLARMECPLASTAIAEALADERAEVVNEALAALASAKSVAHADVVLRLVASPASAFRALDGLLAWYRAVPAAADAAHVLALSQLTTSPAGNTAERARVLDALANFAGSYDADVRKSLRSLVESPARELREGALVALALDGDRVARRELLDGYDERIDANRDFAASWIERGAVLYRLGDYRESERDWRQALKLGANDLRARQDVAWVGLARCLAKQNKLKDASESLARAPLTQKQLEELRTDPAFEKLVEHPRYGQVFGTR